MHEESLVKSLLNQVDDVLDQHGADSSTGIEVEIGELSGVEPELVRSAYLQLSQASRCSGATLRIHESPLVIACSDCRRESAVDQFVFRCADCGSGSVEVVRGDQFRLLTVSFDAPQHTGHHAY